MVGGYQSLQFKMICSKFWLPVRSFQSISAESCFGSATLNCSSQQLRVACAKSTCTTAKHWLTLKFGSNCQSGLAKAYVSAKTLNIEL